VLRIWLILFWNVTQSLSQTINEAGFLLYVGNCQSNYAASLSVKAIILIITAMRHYPMFCVDGLGKNTGNPQDNLSLNFEFQT